MTFYAKAFLFGGEVGIEEAKRIFASEKTVDLVQAAKRSAARNERFVEMLAAQTFEAESTGSLLAKKLEIDFLLRLAGTTQIARAIRGRGATPGEPFLLVVAGRSPVNGEEDLKGMELVRRTLSQSELLGVERAALLGAQRA